MQEPYIIIPTNKEGVWTTTEFQTREEFRDFVKSLFKKPGKYDFDETGELFNEQSRNFTKNGFYTKAPQNSKDYLDYWGTLKNENVLSEKSKCRVGVIFINKEKTFYLTRDYYFWINFLPIYDKVKKKFTFPEIWDSQYHATLYELLAELHYNHVAILKKRQWGGTYLHISKVINKFWFEQGSTLKIGASLKDYVNEKGAWKFLNEYRKFLNANTGWYRPCDPDKTLTWQQRAKAVHDGKEIYIGSDSTITGYSFEHDPTSGVGGNVDIFYHEEAGIAPKMNTTYEFIRPALSSGMITTGLFIASGSVGDLKQCQPLKEMLLRPEANSIYPVETDLLDDSGKIGISALFIPEQWSMTPYIDKYGNSLVEEALEAIKKEREQWKKDLSAAQYQLRISQKPINIYEAFAYREESLFPLRLINKQMERIQNKQYSVRYVNLERADNNKVIIKDSNKLPILDFPISKTLDDKTGVVCIHEEPMQGDIPWGMYYASIDTVATGKTSTSDSLCTIYVYRNTSEVAKIDANGQIENRLDEGKIVAWWAGRFDNIEDTHKTLENIIDLYRAWTIVEKNRGSFIPYMINKKKQHLLVPTSQLLVFNKDLKSDSEVFGEYGWNNSKPVYQRILGYLIDWLQEVIESTDISSDKDGSKLVNRYGVEKLPDIMALREMAAYGDGNGNFDRIISLSALIAFATIQEANLGFKKRFEKIEKVNLEKSEKSSIFSYGDNNVKPNNPWSKPTGAFKHFR